MSDYISKSALIEDIKRRPYIDKALEEIFFTIIDEQPTVDETEIIRKAFERVLERLEEKSQKWADVYNLDFDKGHINEYADFLREGIDKAIEIVKEECGISE